MRPGDECPCIYCPYDCDNESNCVRYLRWSAVIEEEQRNKEMAALNRKYKSALKRVEKFNKAKEVIEGLMRFCRCFAQHHTEDIRYKEAEQFLKEVEGGN